MFTLMKAKRGMFDAAVGGVYALIVIAFLLGAGLLALNAFSNALPGSSAAQNAVNAVITAISNFVTQLGTVGTMLGIALLIAVVFGGVLLYFTGNKGIGSS